MMEENALSRMKILIEEADTDIEFDTQIRHGRTDREILGCVDRENVDLVVMGSRGQSALTRAVLGSVSEKLAHDLPVPVFLIPEAAKKTTISKLIFTTDFRADDPDNYLYAATIAKLLAATVSVVHISADDNFNTKIRHLGFTEILRNSANDDALSVDIVQAQSLLQGLTEYVNRHKNSAVVFNRYKKSILQKLFKRDHTDEMVVYADLPLLIIPPGN